jgi:hypothetical protein
LKENERAIVKAMCMGHVASSESELRAS